MSEGVTPPQVGPNSAFVSLFQIKPRCHQDGENLRKGTPAPCRLLTAEERPGPRQAVQPALAPGPGPRSRRESAPPRGPARRFYSGASRATVGRCPRPLPGRERRCGRLPGAHAPALPPDSHCTAIVCAPVRAGRGRPGGLVSREARSPLWPASGCSALTYLAGGAGRGPGLVAGAGGGASRPSDHLWKRAVGRGGGRLLVQLQPTSRSRFGDPRFPASARSPPRYSAGPRSRWAASTGQPRSARALTPIPPPAPG